MGTGEQILEIAFAMLIRGGLSFLAALMLGFVSLALLSSTIPPTIGGRLDIIAVGVGICTGIPVFLAWLKPESNRGVIATGFALALGIAVFGSVAGYILAGILELEVRNDRLISRGSATTSAIWVFAISSATVLSTAVCGIYYGFRLWRYHEV